MTHFFTDLKPSQVQKLLEDGKINLSHKQLTSGGKIKININTDREYNRLMKNINEGKKFTGVMARHIEGGKLSLKGIGKQIKKGLKHPVVKGIAKAIGHTGVEMAANMAGAYGVDPNMVRAIGHSAVESKHDNLRKIRDHHVNKAKDELMDHYASQYGNDYNDMMHQYQDARQQYREFTKPKYSYDMSAYGDGLKKRGRPKTTGGKINWKNVGKKVLKSTAHVGLATLTSPLGALGSTIIGDQVNPIVDKKIDGCSCL